MKIAMFLAEASLALVLCGPIAAGPQVPSPEGAVLAEGHWVASPADNICGISNVRKVSNPGVVDYPLLWDATPEIRKLKDEGIDPESPEGKALRNQAKTRITKACQKVQRAAGLCSVWKAIHHTGDKKPLDITARVRALFPKGDE